MNFLFLSAALIGCGGDSGDTKDFLDVTDADFGEPGDCDWERGDPGDLVATGVGVGDVIADWSAIDQCEQEYRIWDGAGNYTLILSVAFW